MSWTIGPKDAEAGGKALFEFRRAAAIDPDPRYRQAMTYSKYEWADLPEAVKTHHRTMFLHGAATLGVKYDAGAG